MTRRSLCIESDIEASPVARVELDAWAVLSRLDHQIVT